MQFVGSHAGWNETDWPPGCDMQQLAACGEEMRNITSDFERGFINVTEEEVDRICKYVEAFIS